MELLLSPVCSYGILRFETPYFDRAEARAMLKKKLKELDDWVDEALEDGWLSICNLQAYYNKRSVIYVQLTAM